MNSLSTDILSDFGFVRNQARSTALGEVFSRGRFHVIFKDGGFFYSNLGIDYPLKDPDTLRRLFREVTSQELLRPTVI